MKITKKCKAIAAGMVMIRFTPLLTTLAACSGCSTDVDHPKDASPIVQTDSAEGKKAIAETEKLVKLRKEQEARARKRARGLPTED